MQTEKAGNYILERMSRELPDYLLYHNVEHVKDVHNAASMLAWHEGISDYETQLLLTAAWYHDAGYINGVKNHEEESCRIAKATLPDFGYNENEIDLICGMIMATRIPQSPFTPLEKILADADLDYLGRDDFQLIGERLYQELLKIGAITSIMEWNQMQVSFLESHRYFTNAAISLRNDKKQQHLQQLKKSQQETAK